MVENWRSCWKWLSTYGLAVIGMAPIAYENMTLLQDVLPPKYFHIIISILAVLTFILRLKNQSGTTPK